MKSLPWISRLCTASVLATSMAALPLPALSHQGSGMMQGQGGSMMQGQGGGMMQGQGGGMMQGQGGGMMGGGMMGGGMMGGGHTGMMGGSMMHGGHMGMMSKYKGLGLSDEQKQQLRGIQHKLRKKHWELMGLMIDEQAALQEAHAGDRPDPAAVGAVYGRMFDIKRQMIEAKLTAKNSSQDVLTEEQRARMKTGKHKRRGMMQDEGGMMHGQGEMMQKQDCPPQNN